MNGPIDRSDVSVSICIASYNMADTIEQSLTSIVEHLPSSFEIVVVDQSTDGSKRIIEEVAANAGVEFTTIYTDFPLGVGHARNLAVCAADGDIVVTHVDADDWYDSRYFLAMVDLYLRLREAREEDFFFSTTNMNISSRAYMQDRYLLSSLPIGANEKEYRWRAHRNGDYLGLTVDADVSGRIKLSDRKTFTSRVRRTYRRHLGMFRIGYSARRVLREDVLMGSWSLHSRAFRAAILPIVWMHALFCTTPFDSPIPGTTLPELTEAATYSLAELAEEYEIGDDARIFELVGEA